MGSPRLRLHQPRRRRSAEGKLRVELAQLEYSLPRMRGMWKYLERLGAGVGTRGRRTAQSRSTNGRDN